MKGGDKAKVKRDDMATIYVLLIFVERFDDSDGADKILIKVGLGLLIKDSLSLSLSLFPSLSLSLSLSLISLNVF